MSNQALIFDVTDKSYGKYVMLNSHKVPVVMAFIGAWSDHCYVLTEIFTALAKEYPEDFVFAKLDIDENPVAKETYEIKNVPTVIIFKDGEPVRREEGILSYEEARKLLNDFGIYRESDETRSNARVLHMQGDTPQAITLLTEAIQKDPSNMLIALDMVQIFIDIGQVDDASGLLERLPQAERDSDVGKGLAGQLWVFEQAKNTDGIQKLTTRIENNSNDYDAHFDKALCELAIHNIDEAMAHLFYILEQRPEYRDGAAKEMVVSVINTLSLNNPEVAQAYRRQLSNLLNE